MKTFDYVTPQTLQEAAAVLSQYHEQAKVLAGGTDLLVQMRAGTRAAAVVVDVKKIPELNELVCNTSIGLQIGAAVPCFRIWNDAAVARLYPGLRDAVALIGGIQIQSRATLGGNVSNASPAADSIPALIVHESICEIVGDGGVRNIPVENLCAAPGRTILNASEFIARFHIPPPVSGFGASYLRFIPRNEMDIAVASAGAAVVLDQGGERIVSARVALGAVAPTPLLVTAAGDALAGQPVSDEVINEAAQLAAAAARPISDVRGSAAQRIHLAAVLTRRALDKAIQRARESLREAQP